MRHVFKIGILGFSASVAALAGVVGCGSDPPLRTESSTSGIRAAEEVGASKIPRAALHLQLAKEELEFARKLQADGEPEQAASLLTRAEADAQLAVALSREEAEKAEALAAVDRVRQLRQDNK